MNPKSYGYKPKPVKAAKIFHSKEEKARYELEQGDAELARLKALRSAQLEEVMQLRMTLAEAENHMRDTDAKYQKRVERSVQLETFLALAEEI